MRRGKSQVLYNYLPGCTFDYDNDEGIYIVKDFYNRKLDTDEINTQYITKKIVQYLAQWPERQIDLLDAHHHHSYYYCKVTSVKSALFPLTFQCVNERCRRVYSFRSLENVVHSCRHCGKSIRQLHFIAYHSCGEIKPLYVPKCPAHEQQSIVLDTKNSQRIANFVWYCAEPGCSFTRRVFQVCNCDEREHMNITVHSKSETFFPHQVVFINLRDDLIEKWMDDKTSTPHVILAAYFQLFDHPNTSLRALLSNAPDQDEQVEQMISALYRNLGYTEEMIAIEVERALANSRNRENDQVGRLKQQVEQLVPLDEASLAAAAEQLFELIKLKEESKIKIKPLKKWFEDISGRAALIESYKRALDRVGLNDVYLIENLPVTTAVFGYTRGSREPGSARIKPFPTSSYTENKYPVYVDTTNSESLLFELDHRRVLAWLKLNGLHDLDVEQMTDAEVKAWFLMNLGEIGPFGHIDQTDKITTYTYGLVHSLSHLILKSCTLMSGFDRSSLSEYIFEKALSFIIYSNNRQNFVIGGMYTAFENHLAELLNRVVDFGDSCVYDPICSEHGGACHGCMHIAEFSCDGYNRNLGRSYVFGGSHHDGTRIVGFFEMDVRTRKSD
ncbi:hypothetical protein [Brevibacillus fulvus]|uniref:Uncharacterized protein n=1 Tax=Brevibacillus fulvus TaxID=1125967 RepID=A0A938Y5C7_9BACL|nr:hypothetical protein [Brevibacillus fulvus]MBM7591867.1 hypothetical protein [Brevibacillus fulvus]